MEDKTIVWLIDEDDLFTVDEVDSDIPGAILGVFDGDQLLMNCNELDRPVNMGYFLRLWNAQFPKFPLEIDQILFESDGEFNRFRKKTNRKEAMPQGIPSGGRLRDVGKLGEELVHLIPGLIVVRSLQTHDLHDVDFEVEWNGVNYGVEVKTNARSNYDPYRYKLTGYGAYSLNDIREAKTNYVQSLGLTPGTLGITVDFENLTFDACLLPGEIKQFLGGANTVIAQDVSFENANKISPLNAEKTMEQRIPKPFTRPGETSQPSWKKRVKPIFESPDPDQVFGSESRRINRWSSVKEAISMGLTPQEFYDKYKEILENPNARSMQIEDAYKMLSRSDLPETHRFPDLIEFAKQKMDNPLLVSMEGEEREKTFEELQGEALDQAYNDIYLGLKPYNLDLTEDHLRWPTGERDGYFTFNDMLRKLYGPVPSYYGRGRKPALAEASPEEVYAAAIDNMKPYALKGLTIPEGFFESLEYGSPLNVDAAGRRKRHEDTLNKWPVVEGKVATKTAVHWVDEYPEAFNALTRQLKNGEITQEEYDAISGQFKEMAKEVTIEDLDSHRDAIHLRAEETGDPVRKAVDEFELDTDMRLDRRKQLLDKYPIRAWGNILDPIREELDQRVFDGIEPRLVYFRQHINHIKERFRQHGFNPHAFDFYLTGSICTYQYADDSDVDITIINTLDDFTDIDRADLVKIVTMSLDGKKFPGTPYPFQHFVQPPGVQVEELFGIGLRSAYNFQTEEWIAEPSREKLVDIRTEYPDWFQEAIQWSDKMNTLIDNGDYDAAYEVYKELAVKRREAFKAGLGDISSANVRYKYVVNNGTVDRLRLVGFQIATHVKEAARPQYRMDNEGNLLDVANDDFRIKKMVDPGSSDEKDVNWGTSGVAVLEGAVGTYRNLVELEWRRWYEQGDRTRQPQSGRAKVVFFYNGYVRKVPKNQRGSQEIDVEFERSRQPYVKHRYNVARSEMDDNGVLIQEQVTPAIDEEGLPAWVQMVDSGQVGWTKDKQLRAFDTPLVF